MCNFSPFFICKYDNVTIYLIYFYERFTHRHSIHDYLYCIWLCCPYIDQFACIVGHQVAPVIYPQTLIQETVGRRRSLQSLNTRPGQMLKVTVRKSCVINTVSIIVLHS